MRREALLEVAAWLVAAGALAAFLAPVLGGARTLGHDNLYWNYPFFHVFGEALLNGRLPLWNPFTHGGEPFYPLLLHGRLLDASSALVVLYGRWLTTDLVVLYGWDRFLRGLIGGVGVYLLLRPWTGYRLTRLSLITVLALSSIFWAPMRQPVLADHLVPYVGIFLFRVLAGDGRWRNWLAGALFFGLSAQSYFFTGSLLLILFTLVGALLFRRDLLGNVLSPRWPVKALATALVVGALSLPNIVVLTEMGRFIFPARTIEPAHRPPAPLRASPLREISHPSAAFRAGGFDFGLVLLTGTQSSPWDFVQLAAPLGHPLLRGGRSGGWGQPSEGLLYIGLLPYCLALLGALAGTHPLKRVWLVVGAGVGLVSLGPEAGLHGLVYLLVPPLRFLRHTHTLSPIVATTLLFFFVLGLDRLLSAVRSGTAVFAVDPRGPTPGTQPPRLLRSLSGAALLALCLGGVALIALQAEYPFTFYMAAVLPLAGVAAVLGARRLGAAWTFWVLLAVHLALVVAFSVAHRDARSLLMLLAFLIAPLGAGVILHRRWRPPPPALGAVLLGVVLLDLSVFSIHAAEVFPWPRPDRVLAYPAAPRRPSFPHSRRVTPPYPYATSPYPVAPPYLSALQRIPTVFTPFMLREPGLSAPRSVLEEIAAATTRPRMTSLLMLKGYGALINSHAPWVIAEAFAVGRPLVQFFEGFDRLSDEEALERFREREPGAAWEWLRRHAVLAPGPEPPAGLPRVPFGERPARPGAPGGFAWTVEASDDASLHLTVRAPAAGLLYWADGYDPYWRATVDGREVPVYRANLNFKAIALMPGDHDVRFEYWPTPFMAALGVFYAVPAGLLLGGLLVLLYRVRRERRSASPASPA